MGQDGTEAGPAAAEAARRPYMTGPADSSAATRGALEASWRAREPQGPGGARHDAATAAGRVPRGGAGDFHLALGDGEQAQRVLEAGAVARGTPRGRAGSHMGCMS